jgi:hypothetical protein
MKYQVGDLLSSRYDLTLTDINNVNFECYEGDLLLVIEDMDKNDFFDKVRVQCRLNFEKGEDVSLTKTQIIDIVSELVKTEKKKIMVKTKNIFQSTNFGEICLN